LNPEEFEAAGRELVDDGTPSATPAPRSARRVSNRAGAAAGAILVGGGAIVALLGPLSVNAESPSPDPSASQTTVTTTAAETTTTAATTTNGRGPRGGPSGPGGPGGHVEAVSDTSVAAKAIGISEADLLTAIQSGKTIAEVATANSVDPQKVIDALTQDGLDELAAAVTAGTITQAQADAQKADVATRAADQVNNAFHGGGPGGRGPGGPGGHVEAVSDTSVAANAIGISEADLLTAIQSGKTIGAVATANNVDPQKVIDALTQDGLDELAAAVKAGTLTEAQADAQKADVAARAADQVNSTHAFH